MSSEIRFVRGVIAEAQWYRWGSAFVRAQRSHELRSLLHPWPVDRPRRWIKLVNEPQTPAEEASVKLYIHRGRPLGSDNWTARIVTESLKGPANL